MPIGSRAVKRSRRPVASRRNSRARWISWSWRTTRTAWGSSRWSSPEVPRSWPIRRVANGTSMIHSGKGEQAALDIIVSFGKGTISKAIFPVPGTAAYRGAWQETIAAAEAYNAPGRFTAFIGFEWTSNTGGNNLHRNVIFRDNGCQGQPGRTVHHPETARQRQSRGPLEVDGGVRTEDRWQRARPRAQRQSEQRPHVSRGRGLREGHRP